MEKETIIETLLLWNFWEKEIDTGIKREGYLKEIEKYLGTDEVVVITGVRRSGKSTILLQALSELLKKKVPPKNTLYVNFEDPKFYNFLEIGLLDAGKLLENAVFHQLKRRRKEIYYFKEKQEVDFICKKGPKITEIINVCYSLADKETLLREISALKEAARYFGLKTAKIIVAEDDKREIDEKNLTISVLPFYQWSLQE